MTQSDAAKPMSLEAAKSAMLSAVDCRLPTSSVALHNLPGRVLATDIVATSDSPPADNSAMDGYALRACDLGVVDEFEVAGRVMAGDAFKGVVGAGQAVRIMTGAPLPAGADTVVMQENVEVSGEYLHGGKPCRMRLLEQPKPGANVRKAGEDMARGETVYTAGRRLNPVDIGILATLGMAEAEVRAPLRVALFASGDELRAPGERLEPGEIYDSNRYFLRALLSRHGYEVVDLGVVADDPALLREAYSEADSRADAVITCGGASVGEADYARDLLAATGEVGFWKVAIKPGKPFIFGHLSNSVFFGLPGNPVSALVTFQQLVAPCLQKMQGAVVTRPLLLTAVTTLDIKRNRSRLDFQRGLFATDEQGRLCVTPDRQQSSGALGPLSRCNCFIRVAPGSEAIRAGEAVDIELFDF